MKALGKKPPTRGCFASDNEKHYRTTILEARDRIKHIKTLPTSVKKHRALAKLEKDLGISAGEEGATEEKK